MVKKASAFANTKFYEPGDSMSISKTTIALPVIFLLIIIMFTGCDFQFPWFGSSSDDSSDNGLGENEVEITLSTQNKYNDISTQSAIKGEKLGELPLPARTGYTFLGWYDREYGGNRILSNMEVDFREDATYYGQWIKNDAEDSAIGASYNHGYASTNSSIYTKPDTSGPGLPILMYHWFYEDEPNLEQLYDNNWMPTTEFEEQMQYLHDENYYFPTWEEVEAFIDGDLFLPKKSVVVTADDGRKNFFETGIPILEKYEIDATGFLITSRLREIDLDDHRSDYVQFRSHSHDIHIRSTGGIGVAMNMPLYEIVADLHKSKEIVDQAYVFCYPFGHYNDTIKEALAIEGFHLAVTVNDGRVYPGSDKMTLPRVRMSSGNTLEMFINLIEAKQYW